MLNLAHKKLDVYKIAFELIKEIYVLTKYFPPEEKYGIVSQLRRAAVSVCSNIAEGCARKSKQEKKRFFEISRSSVVEIDTQIQISLVIGYLKQEQVGVLENYLERIFMMICKMIEKLNAISESPKSKDA